MPIYSTTSLKNFTVLSITRDSGTIETFYYGINTEESIDGFIYVYESINLRNFSRLLYFPSQNTISFNSSTSNITLFYVGPSSNDIIIASRIHEHYTQNCDSADNLDIANIVHLRYSKTISAKGSGNCLFSILMPTLSLKFDQNEYHSYIILNYFEYIGSGSVSTVSGYNDTFKLFEFDNQTDNQWTNNAIPVSLLSFIIPPNGTLIITYSPVIYGNFCIAP